MESNHNIPESASSVGSRVRRFWWLPLLILIFSVAGGVLISKTGKGFSPKFSARATVDLGSDAVSISDMDREARIMTSTASLIAALKAGGLAAEPEFQGDEAEVARLLSQAVHVSLRRGTRLVDIEVITGTGPSAVKLANAVAETYVKQTTAHPSSAVPSSPPRVVDFATKATPLAALGGRRKLMLMIGGVTLVLLLLALVAFRKSSH